MNILVVAAHPDDEVLGCGGTLARLAGQGHQTHVLILGEGGTSRHEMPVGYTLELADRSSKACAELGVVGLRMEKLPDNQFDTLPLLRIIQRIEAAILELAPQVVYTHHPGDLNNDHGTTFRATLTAVRPMRGTPVRSLYTFEVPSSTEWAFGALPPGFQPDTYCDISPFLGNKLRAMDFYSCEQRPFPHPRSPEGITALAQTRGVAAGIEAAEAFSTVFNIW